ncbi:MAG: DUF6788 family protein [Actinomycetota bacterium]
MSAIKEIRKLEERRARALDKIFSIKLMVPGSYNEVYCRCGKKNCWCSSGKGHPFRRITFSEDGKPKTKSIPKENVEWIKKVTQNYRQFREGQKKIREYEVRLGKLLDRYLKEIIVKTRKKKEYN